MLTTLTSLKRIFSSRRYEGTDGISDPQWAREGLIWKNICFQTNTGKSILENVSGHGELGEMLAIMGPSGSGKTTLLNSLAQRSMTGVLSGDITINGAPLNQAMAAQVSTFVQQEDALIGALTVRETLTFIARLAIKSSEEERTNRVERLITDFGLTEQADVLVGTPVKKGISGGQKRRLSVASQLIMLPQVCFLDEPTSGLDSLAAYEIVSLLRRFAHEHEMIMVAAIHSPSTATYQQFDKVLLLSKGKMVYYGPVNCEEYLSRAQCPIPPYYNTADHLLDVTNTDFSKDEKRLQSLISFWEDSPEAQDLSKIHPLCVRPAALRYRPNVAKQTWILLHRLFLKSLRDVLPYYVRLGMNIGVAILMGTVWLRLGSNQDKIVAYINAIYFASSFLSFMSVAYIPSFLEDRSVLIKDRANGLYSALPFLLSNAIIGVPFLCIIAVTSALITYWLVGLQNTVEAFICYTVFLFLDLLAAESLVVLVSSTFPTFVAALGVTSFANGLFMCSGGFLVPPSIMQPFYYYFFYQINFMRFVFESLMKNEFAGRVYECDSECRCIYFTPLASQCKIAGEGVLSFYGYGEVDLLRSGAILVAISFVMRVMAWMVLHFMRK